jgi:Zn ribbon nucleic-acid-binding protein
LLSVVGGSATGAVIICPANKPFHQAAGMYPDAYPNCSQAPYHQAYQDPQLQLCQCFECGHAGSQRTDIAPSCLQNRHHQYQQQPRKLPTVSDCRSSQAGADEMQRKPDRKLCNQGPRIHQYK